MSGKENKPALSPTILGLADLFRENMKEMEQRVIAVSEMEVNRTNLPTLPIAMVALVDVTFRHAEKTNSMPHVVEQIVAEFWFKNNKIRTTKNEESPFWAYYDYDPLLHKVVSLILDWTTPKGFKLKVTRMDLESTEAAVHITFEFFHDYEFCPSYDEFGEQMTITPHITAKVKCEDQQLKV